VHSTHEYFVHIMNYCNYDIIISICMYLYLYSIFTFQMNGPGITTLPDVCSDAGRILFITLIFLSVAMASFVCRRMVSAMWSTIDNETAVSVGKNEDYGSGIEHSLSIDGEVIDEVIPQVMSDESEKLTHREHEHEENDEEDQYTETEGESLIPQDTKVHDRPQLESTSIVGQSLEAYGKQTSVYTSFLMVASALCLGLAQMVSFLSCNYIECNSNQVLTYIYPLRCSVQQYLTVCLLLSAVKVVH